MKYSQDWAKLKLAGTGDAGKKQVPRLVEDELAGQQLSLNDPAVRAAYAAANGLPANTDADAIYTAVHANALKGLAPMWYRTSGGTIQSTNQPIPQKPKPRIMLVETYALTSFLGDYGAGRTVNTFSLLPNEKTTITIDTWKKTETTTKQASSILDSWTKDTQDNFDKSVQSENSNREQVDEASGWYVDAKVSAHYDVGIWGADAQISGGAHGSSNTSRENVSKNVSSAAEKHVANVSSKRNVEVNTSFEAKAEAGEEQSVKRELENINAGRVLNFVFRQLNQEYVTYLHLVDVRLGFADGMGSGPDHYKEYTLDQIDAFLETYIRDPKPNENPTPRDQTRTIILNELRNIIDYKGVSRQFVEAVDLVSGQATDIDNYLDPAKRPSLYPRIKTSQFYQKDDAKQPNYEDHLVDGIILAKNKYVLPTDSVVVEALLGQAEALDKYSTESRQAVIDMKRLEIEKARLANEIIATANTKEAELYARVFRAPLLLKEKREEEIETRAEEATPPAA